MTARSFLIPGTVAAVLMLMGGCGSDDPPAPRIDSDQVLVISPFDTVTVTFSEAMEPLQAKHLTAEPSGIKWKMEGDRTIKIWGKEVWPKGSSDSTFSLFEPNTDYTFTFADVLSLEGRGMKGKQEVQAEVIPMIDTDFRDGYESNGNWSTADPLYIDSVFASTGKRWGGKQSFAGILAGDFVSGHADMRDWYALELNRHELQFQLELKSPQAKELSLYFYGPVPADQPTSKPDTWEVDKAENPKAQGAQTLSIKVGIERHEVGLDDTQMRGERVRYYIRVGYQSDSEFLVPIPYVLSFNTTEKGGEK